MRLTIETLTKPMKAVLVAQTFAGRSAASLVGTKHLMNCLGVVIHNRLGHVGVVGHIESQSSIGVYNEVAKAAMTKMFADLNKNGGGTGSVSVVLLGNKGAQKVAFDRNLFGIRLAYPNDFKDLRGTAGACILDPVKEVLYTDAVGANVGEAGSNKGVTIYSIQ